MYVPLLGRSSESLDLMIEFTPRITDKLAPSKGAISVVPNHLDDFGKVCSRTFRGCLLPHTQKGYGFGNARKYHFVGGGGLSESFSFDNACGRIKGTHLLEDFT